MISRIAFWSAQPAAMRAPSLRTDALDLQQLVRRLLDDVEDLLAECPHQLAGVDGADALDHAGAKVPLDAVIEPHRMQGRARMAAATNDLMTTYVDADALALADLVHRGEVSPQEVVETAITVIEKLNPQLNAVIHRLYDMARRRAGQIDLAAPFAGVPFLLKELASSWQGAPLTNSSAYLKDVVADSDSEVVRRIEEKAMLA